MSTQMLKKLSDELVEVRTKKDISIEQIFTKTRIDKKYLAAIEEGNFSIMPEVYIRAFLKQYSNSIGLDPEEVLSKFEKAQKGIDYSAPVEDDKKVKSSTTEKKKEPLKKMDDVSPKKDIPEMSPKPNVNKTVYYALAGILMLLFIFVVYKVFLTEPNTEIITEKPFEEVIESQQNHQASPSVKEEQKTEQAKLDVEKIEPKQLEQIKTKPETTTPEKVKEEQVTTPQQLSGLNLTIVGSDKSWIRVVTDDKDNIEFIIDKNVTKVLNAKEKFYLHIGNSGGVKLLLNNTDLNFTGSQGRVRKINITKNGIEYLRRTPTLNASE